MWKGFTRAERPAEIDGFKNSGDREGLAGIQELQRAGSTQIQLGLCRTLLDPAPIRSSPGYLAESPPGSSAQPGAHRASPLCVPKSKPMFRAQGISPEPGKPLLPGQGHSILLLRVPCPGLAAPPSARLRQHPGLAPAFPSHHCLQEKQERLGLCRTAPGCAPALRPGNPLCQGEVAPLPLALGMMSFQASPPCWKGEKQSQEE